MTKIFIFIYCLVSDAYSTQTVVSVLHAVNPEIEVIQPKEMIKVSRRQR